MYGMQVTPKWEQDVRRITSGQMRQLNNKLFRFGLTLGGGSIVDGAPFIFTDTIAATFNYYRVAEVLMDFFSNGKDICNKVVMNGLTYTRADVERMRARGMV